MEIIIVNDCSTDNSASICASFAKKDSRIIFVNKKINEGLVSARISGLNLATGDYIFNLDGDDWISSKCIEDLVNIVKSFNVDIVVNSFYREFVGELVHKVNYFPEGFYNKKMIKEIILPELISTKDKFSHGITTYSWGKLFKRSLVSSIQEEIPNDFTVGEDAVLTYPAIDTCDSLYIINRPSYFYRQRTSSMLKSINSNLIELAYIEKMTSYLKRSLFNYNYDLQIDEYKKSLSIIRTGGYLDSNFDNFLSKFKNDINSISKIGIYSTGSFGQQLFFRCLDEGDYEIFWFDADFDESKIFGLPIHPLNEDTLSNLDLVIIATTCSSTFNSIRALLLRHNISPDKIIFPSMDSIYK